MNGLLLLLLSTLFLQGQSLVIKPQAYNFTKQEGIDLVNSLFKACNPDLPENAYMLPYSEKNCVGYMWRKLHTVSILVSYSMRTANSEISQCLPAIATMALLTLALW